MTTIDVVIPTRDRPEALARCLEALSRQTHPDFRVIVVDDASDPPATISLDLRERLALTLIRSGEPGGAARARNIGIAAGSAPYIAFIDDDVWAEAHLLDRHYAAMDGESVVSLGSLAAPPDWTPTLWNRWEWARLEHEYQRMERGENTPTFREFHTGNAFVPRLLLERAGPFSEELTRAEDVELGIRLQQQGARFVFTRTAVGWRYADGTSGTWLAIPRAYGALDRRINELHPEVGLLAMVARERARRHRLVRIARRTASSRPLRALTVNAAMTSARVASSLGMPRRAMGALSVAFDIEYERGAQAAEAAREQRARFAGTSATRDIAAASDDPQQELEDSATPEPSPADLAAGIHLAKARHATAAGRAEHSATLD
jgi:GT2 family glycosyltransferase